MKFSKYVRMLERENIVILVNMQTRNWYRVSKNIFEVVNYGIEKGYTCKELLEDLYDEEDRNIIFKVINNLKTIGVILENQENESVNKLDFTVAITDRCNLMCTHCSYNAKQYHTTEKITYNQIQRRLEKILVLNPASIAFTGGEPMVREDFIEISKWLKTKFDGRMILMTNGTLITEENVKKITTVYSQIDISIDGVDENTCSQIRGAGVFAQVIKAVKLLQKEGFTKISLSMVDTHVNHRFIDQFYSLNKKLNTFPVLRVFSDVGRGRINKNQLYLRQQDYSENPKNLTEQFKESDKKKIKASGCGAGKEVFFIDYDGSIYGCAPLREFGYKLGEIEQIEKVINPNNNNIYNEMINKVPKKCKLCDVNIFCIECLADILKNGETKYFKSICAERKKYYEQLIWKKE